VSSDRVHIFSKEASGSLSLELGVPAKQVFRGLTNTRPWRASGLIDEAPEVVKDRYLFEYQPVDYTYSVRDDAPLTPPFRLLINDRLIKESTHRVREGVHLLAGRFSIEDGVGTTLLRILDAKGQQVFGLETEVYPQKMDFASDYQAMLADISSIINSLTYDVLKDTYRHSRAKVTGHSTEPEWHAILESLFDQLIKNLQVIKRQPKHEIRTEDQVLPLDKVRKASKRNLDWLRKNARFARPGATGMALNAELVATHALACRKYVTYDTYENRFVAWAIGRVLDRLRKYKRSLKDMKGVEAHGELLKRLTGYQGRLQAILHGSPFDEVGEFEQRAYFSTSLTRGAGYRDFLVIHLLLTRGLEIWDNEVFRVGQKNISTLYEYWCFLKLVQLLKEQMGSGCDLRDLIKISANKVHVQLRKGNGSSVHFTNDHTGDKATLFYNKEFTKSAGRVHTYDQVPDIALRLEKPGYKHPFWQVFDAKYRFDEKVRESGATYDAPQDAIGQLHRYRDAILHTMPEQGTYRKAVKNLGGAILYPYPLSEEQFKGSAFYKSISSVNIGALPFLPSKTGLVAEYTRSLISKRAEDHFENVIEMDRTEYEAARARWTEWVTIGLLRREHLAARRTFFLETGLFHVPYVKDVHSKLFQSRELLVCEAGDRTAYRCTVESWEIMMKPALKDLGVSWDLHHDRYVVFRTTGAVEVETPNPIAPTKFRYSTKEGLDRYLSSGDPAQFYLTGPDAARLLDSLRDMGADVLPEWANDRDPSAVVFNVGDLVIKSYDSYSPLHYMVGKETLSLKKVMEKVAEVIKP
jgi:predicted component of viral defense system (DUF524 family)